MNLNQWQKDCSNYFVKGIHPQTGSLNNLSIYKKSIEANYINALTISFPVVNQLLGKRTFNLLSKEYIKSKNWSAPSLDDLGEDLDIFIADHQLSSHLIYLSEVARVEWKIQSLSEELPRLDDLQSVFKRITESIMDCDIQLRSHVGLVNSERGGMEVWQAHQKKSFEIVNLDSLGNTSWLLVNGNEGLFVEPLSLQNRPIIQQIENGDTVNNICKRHGVSETINVLSKLLTNQQVSFLTKE